MPLGNPLTMKCSNHSKSSHLWDSVVGQWPTELKLGSTTPQNPMFGTYSPRQSWQILRVLCIFFNLMVAKLQNEIKYDKILISQARHRSDLLVSNTESVLEDSETDMVVGPIK